jgi:hypothetical protein
MATEVLDTDLQKLDAEIDAHLAEREPEPAEQPVQEPSGDADETPGDADAGQQEVVAEGETEVETEAAPSETDWHDDVDTFGFAKRMGISEEDYTEVQTREEFDRLCRLIDRKAYDAEKVKQAPPVQQPTPPVPTQVQQPADVMAGIEKKLLDSLEESGAKPIIEAVRGLNDFWKQQFASVQDGMLQSQKFQEQRLQEQLHTSINTSIDALGNAERYGKPGEKLTRQQAANRVKTAQAHIDHARGLMARGGTPEPSVAFLKSADALAFAEENASQLKLEIQRKQDERLKKQSHRVTGGPSKRRDVAKTDSHSRSSRKQEFLEDPEMDFENAVKASS